MIRFSKFKFKKRANNFGQRRGGEEEGWVRQKNYLYLKRVLLKKFLSSLSGRA